MAWEPDITKKQHREAREQARRERAQLGRLHPDQFMGRYGEELEPDEDEDEDEDEDW